MLLDCASWLVGRLVANVTPKTNNKLCHNKKCSSKGRILHSRLGDIVNCKTNMEHILNWGDIIVYYLVRQQRFC